MIELMTAWDLAHDAITAVVEAARAAGNEAFAREAETIADALEQRVTALGNIARDKESEPGQ